MGFKVQKELSAGEHTIRGVGWGVIWTIVMLVLGYLIVPLSANVNRNEDQLNDIDIRVTVLESKILGSAITIVSIKHKNVLKEIKELAEVVQESYEDKKITKDEQKAILDEVVDVANAIADSWSFKKS